MNDPKEFNVDLVTITILMTLCSHGTAFFIGLYRGVISKENTLVKSGHAEYYLDENNQRQWRMKETK